MTYKQLYVLLGLVMYAQAIGNSIDPSTYANIEEVQTTHLDLDFQVDFNREVFHGKVDHTMLVLGTDVSKVYFDAEGMTVASAQWTNLNSSGQDWADAALIVTRPNANLGDAVEVTLPVSVSNQTYIKIRLFYETNNQTTSISWLKPSQTAGKNLPYLFTQCEDIACRSVAPMQDTPALKITYTAHVVVPSALNVYMSANKTGQNFWNITHNQYTFENQIKMPSYLIAIAVGDLQYRYLGDRSGIITEPTNMDEYANVLSSVPDLLTRSETYLTPYIWGNYSILILPPSFPFGGMENPLLTFASPTIITEDRSQVYVATHEICHSWTGNDVTLENWSNMWLNEGFTVFEERKVSAEIHGVDFSKVNAYLGNISMYNDMLGYGLNNSYSSLHPEIGANYSVSDKPDNSFSEIPYEKGFQLLYYLETLLGEAKMQQLIQEYILMYSQQSIGYEKLVSKFDEFVKANFDNETATNITSQMDWDTWVKGPGLPPVILNFTTAGMIESQALAQGYIDLNGTSSPVNYTDYEKFYSSLKVIFIEHLIQNSSNVNVTLLEKIDSDLNITNTTDPECKQRWFPLGIKTNYTAVMEPAHTFVSVQGRMKYLAPIYQALVDSNQTALGVQWFNENIDFYHPYSVEQVKKILGITDAPTPAKKNINLYDMLNQGNQAEPMFLN